MKRYDFYHQLNIFFETYFLELILFFSFLFFILSEKVFGGIIRGI